MTRESRGQTLRLVAWGLAVAMAQVLGDAIARILPSAVPHAVAWLPGYLLPVAVLAVFLVRDQESRRASGEPADLVTRESLIVIGVAFAFGFVLVTGKIALMLVRVLGST